MSKKAMKRVLKDCIKELKTIESNSDIVALIIQFNEKEDRFKVDFHINNAQCTKDEEVKE
jgi:hypothetical protein